MSTRFPDRATIRTALTMAVRAPSVHNTQPWLWRVGDNSVHLYSNPSLRLPSTDPDSRDLMISCGIALNHCAVAFAAVGWLAKVHRFPNPADSSPAWTPLAPPRAANSAGSSSAANRSPRPRTFVTPGNEAYIGGADKPRGCMPDRANRREGDAGECLG